MMSHHHTERRAPAQPKERPIIFGAESVRAIIKGHKTQTRRVIKPQPPQETAYLSNEDPDGKGWLCVSSLSDAPCTRPEVWITCPYGLPGDRLWVREAIRLKENWPPCPPTITYCADDTPCIGLGAPRMYCDRAVWQWPKLKTLVRIPRWASRLTLEITNVRVERVQEINAAECMAEGVIKDPLTVQYRQDIAIGRFAEVWDELNAKRGYSFDSNPWVWVIEFQKVSGD